MRIHITDINGPLEAIFAAGLTQILAIDGVTVECPTISPGFPLSLAAPEREAAGVAPAPAAPLPVKGKPGRKPGASKAVAKREVPAPETVRSPSDDAPKRLTIRQRIKNALAAGPIGSRELAKQLNEQGVNTTTELIGQHLYLMTRDKITKRDDEKNTWSLV